MKIQSCLEKGEALEKFRENVELQNGNPKICDKPEILLDKTLLKFEIKAKTSGFVNKIETDEIGKAICEIGGGRLKVEDSIDHFVGFSCESKLGDRIKLGEILGVLFCRNQKQANLISEKLLNAYKISVEKPEKLELTKTIIE